MTTVLHSIVELVWYFLPALAANSAPVIAAAYIWLPSLAIPLDGGATWHGARLLGNHKTVRGLTVALLFGSITGFIQYLLTIGNVAPTFGFAMYSTPLFAIMWGALLGFGAILGDVLKSFFKRRMGIPPGARWIPWDQLDVVVGVLLVTQWLAPLSVAHIITSFVVIGVGMFATSTFGVAIGIKKSL